MFKNKAIGHLFFYSLESLISRVCPGVVKVKVIAVRVKNMAHELKIWPHELRRSAHELKVWQHELRILGTS